MKSVAKGKPEMKANGFVGFLRERETGSFFSQRYRNCKESVNNWLDTLAAAPSLNQPCEFSGEPKATFLMDCSPDKSMVASTHGDHTVRVTDVATGKCTHILTGHPRTPWCLAFHPSHNDILASGCLGGQVRIWDLRGGGSEVYNSDTNSLIASLTFHPIDHVLVFATKNMLYFWNWTQPAPFASCSTAHGTERVRWVKFDTFGHYLYTGICNNPVNIRPASVQHGYRNEGNSSSIPQSRLRIMQRNQQRYENLLSRFVEYQSRQIMPQYEPAAPDQERPPSPVHEDRLRNAIDFARYSTLYPRDAEERGTTSSARRSQLFGDDQPSSSRQGDSGYHMYSRAQFAQRVVANSPPPRFHSDIDSDSEDFSTQPQESDARVGLYRPSASERASSTQSRQSSVSVPQPTERNRGMDIPLPATVVNISARSAVDTEEMDVDVIGLDDEATGEQSNQNHGRDQSSVQQESETTQRLPSQAVCNPLTGWSSQSGSAFSAPARSSFSLVCAPGSRGNSSPSAQSSASEISLSSAQISVGETSTSSAPSSAGEDSCSSAIVHCLPSTASASASSTSLPCSADHSGHKCNASKENVPTELMENSCRQTCSKVSNTYPNSTSVSSSSLLSTAEEATSDWNTSCTAAGSSCAISSSGDNLGATSALSISSVSQDAVTTSATSLSASFQNSQFGASVSSNQTSSASGETRVRSLLTDAGALQDHGREVSPTINPWSQGNRSCCSDRHESSSQPSHERSETRHLNERDDSGSGGGTSSRPGADEYLPGSGSCTYIHRYIHRLGIEGFREQQGRFPDVRSVRRDVGPSCDFSCTAAGYHRCPVCGHTPLRQGESRNLAGHRLRWLGADSTSQTQGELVEPDSEDRGTDVTGLQQYQSGEAQESMDSHSAASGTSGERQESDEIQDLNCRIDVVQWERELRMALRRRRLAALETGLQSPAYRHPPVVCNNRPHRNLTSLGSLRCVPPTSGSNQFSHSASRYTSSSQPAIPTSSGEQAQGPLLRRCLINNRVCLNPVPGRPLQSNHRSANSQGSSAPLQPPRILVQRPSSEDQQQGTSQENPGGSREGRDPSWLSLEQHTLHPHYSQSILDHALFNRYHALQPSVNTAIAGVFMSSGEQAVASNIVPGTYRIQQWDFRECCIPDISRSEENIVVQHCKIHNDASVDISRDSSLLATFVHIHRGFPDENVLGIFSLRSESFGECLYTKSFGPNAISVSLSPSNKYMMVGLASRRMVWVQMQDQLVGQVFKLVKKGAGEDSMLLVTDLYHPVRRQRSIARGVSPVSINFACWLPNIGEGIIYGTNQGDLHFFRAGKTRADVEKEEAKLSKPAVSTQAGTGGILCSTYTQTVPEDQVQ